MQLQTFKAPTMAEALAQVKREMGTSAVILHTRSYWRRYCLGLRRREIVEITAGKGLNVDRRRQPPGGVPARSTMLPTHQMLAPMQPGKQLLETTAASNVAMLGLTQAMTSLK